MLTLGYDHQNFISSSGTFSYLNQSSELPVARAGFRFNPQLTVGVEGSASFTTYDQYVLNNNQSYSAGVYADWKPGSYFHVQPRAGYTISQFQHSSEAYVINQLGPGPIVVPLGESIQTENTTTWYADLTVSHQVSKAVNYAFSVGHEIRPGIQSDQIEDSYFRPYINWKMVKDLSLGTSLTYERGNIGEGNVTGNLTETYDYYGGGFDLSYPLMKKLLLSLNYRLTLRSSGKSDREDLRTAWGSNSLTNHNEPLPKKSSLALAAHPGDSAFQLPGRRIYTPWQRRRAREASNSAAVHSSAASQTARSGRPQPSAAIFLLDFQQVAAI